MKKNLTEIVFILDRSGSMSGLEADTIGGFNSMIEKQRKADGEALVSTVLFDNMCEVIHDRMNIRDIKPMTDRDYTVRGCTALLDAIGGAIHHIGNVHKYARPEDVPEHTLFIITTDGMENASRFYSSGRVKQMVERQKAKYGWEFLFFGANIDAVETARHFGIGSELTGLSITTLTALGRSSTMRCRVRRFPQSVAAPRLAQIGSAGLTKTTRNAAEGKRNKLHKHEERRFRAPFFSSIPLISS